MPTAWCSAAWSKASGRRRRAAIPGSAGRCGTSSGSICPSGASAFPRTTSRNRSAREDVILTRAAKPGGAPTVASRFLQRLAAVAGETRWDGRDAGAATRYLQYARALDQPDEVKPVARPQPKPPRAARPTHLSVTEIEHWLRDPYTIYAKHILKLLPLDAVDTPPRRADRGTVIHDAIGDFTKLHPASPARRSAATRCARSARSSFAPLVDYPEARAFWWPRFQRIARWFAEWEAVAPRRNSRSIDAEIGGEIEIPIDGDRNFMLRRAPTASSISPTAATPSSTTRPAARRPTSRCGSGLSPQLTLEAAILREGGFEGIPAGASVSELVYVRLQRQRPARRAEAGRSRQQQDRHAIAGSGRRSRACKNSTALIRAFDDETQGYTSLDLPMWKTRYGAYDDLARVKEWSAAGGLGIEEW